MRHGADVTQNGESVTRTIGQNCLQFSGNAKKWLKRLPPFARKHKKGKTSYGPNCSKGIQKMPSSVTSLRASQRTKLRLLPEQVRRTAIQCIKMHIPQIIMLESGHLHKQVH